MKVFINYPTPVSAKLEKKKEKRKPIPGPVWYAQKLIPVQNW
jgi:hypothetical protein